MAGARGGPADDRRSAAARVGGPHRRLFGYRGVRRRRLRAVRATTDEAVRRAALEHLPFLDDARALPVLQRALQRRHAARPGAAAPGARARRRTRRTGRSCSRRSRTPTPGSATTRPARSAQHGHAGRARALARWPPAIPRRTSGSPRSRRSARCGAARRRRCSSRYAGDGRARHRRRRARRARAPGRRSDVAQTLQQRAAVRRSGAPAGGDRRRCSRRGSADSDRVAATGPPARDAERRGRDRRHRGARTLAAAAGRELGRRRDRRGSSTLPRGLEATATRRSPRWRACPSARSERVAAASRTHPEVRRAIGRGARPHEASGRLAAAIRAALDDADPRCARRPSRRSTPRHARIDAHARSHGRRRRRPSGAARRRSGARAGSRQGAATEAPAPDAPGDRWVPKPTASACQQRRCPLLRDLDPRAALGLSLRRRPDRPARRSAGAAGRRARLRLVPRLLLPAEVRQAGGRASGAGDGRAVGAGNLLLARDRPDPRDRRRDRARRWCARSAASRSASGACPAPAARSR